jgi:hypothetical protein
MGSDVVGRKPRLGHASPPSRPAQADIPDDIGAVPFEPGLCGRDQPQLSPAPASAEIGLRLGQTDMDLVTRARSLAEQRLSGEPRRWSHVQGVASKATVVAPIVEPEHADAIVAASWLHDVGYALDIALTGFHPVDGARFAMDAGMPDLVVRLIAFHTGADFEAQQRGLLAELREFTRPPMDILDIVTFVDMTTSPTGEPIDARDRVAEILTRYEPEDPVFDAVSRSASELLAAVERVDGRRRGAEAAVAQPR